MTRPGKLGAHQSRNGSSKGPPRRGDVEEHAPTVSSLGELPGDPVHDLVDDVAVAAVRVHLTALPAMPTRGRGHTGFRGWMADHPLGAFLVLTFAISWTAFAVAAFGGGDLFVVVGAFGPATAAAVVTRCSGGSIRAWFRELWRWRVPARYYLFAFALPPLLVAVVAVELAVVGDPVRVGSLGAAGGEYLATLLLVAAFGGGQEEPGWRGYAQSRFQARWPAFRATLLLGVVWGAWHLPVYGLGGFAGPLLLVWFYTWLYNRTGSVLLCVFLHAGFNTSIQYLDLAERGVGAFTALAVTASVAAAVLVLTTGGLTTSPHNQS